MFILGIDPSLRSTGWAIVTRLEELCLYTKSGVIITSSAQDYTTRLSVLYNGISNILKDFAPGLVVMEQTFVNANPMSSLILAMARGAMMAAVGNAKVRMIESSPNTIKQNFTGHGKATKAQMRLMASTLFHLDGEVLDHNQIDALAAAYTGYLEYKVDS
ncbi:Crossover junction endodeoxyribonuclease RuvC [Rickettsiales endosymbiont of Paramecium tredecaurelia]|uniref:crossover junction endodeoxyribonuclease RuvC n=1 Tax=Candidatus Sarmatiella mevalonica TaxID=2770581 RepID=UPI00192469B7|nr:crossover junction endodeoxyribonuclease RuvC [Candidatus Sarmatiella mevalonica]MBL3284708.1 Crossover junction endodeoxyribonuclease RuvC [Candidatus Sarmatiella mevalonica]